LSNLRIPKHKTFGGITESGKGAMGWFNGVESQMVANY